VVTAFLALVVLVVAVVWLFNRRAEAALRSRVDAIRARGEPVTINDLLARQPKIPNEENMAITLAAAGRKAAAVKMTNDESKLIPYQGNAFLPQTGERWSDAMLKTSESHLSRTDDALRDLHKALKLERSYFIVHWSTQAFDVLIAELSDMRQATKVLVLEVQTAAQQGDREKAERCLREMTPMTHAVEGDTAIIGTLVQIAITALMQDSIERCINTCGLSEPTLREVQISLERDDAIPSMKKAFTVERVYLLDTLQWLRVKGISSIPSRLGGPNSAGQALGFLRAITAMDTVQGLDQYKLLIEAVDQPDINSIRRAMALDDAARQLPWYCVVSRILVPSLSRSVVLWVRTVGSNRALRAAIAAERFRLANQHWPNKLEELVPTYLDAVPLDPIDGRPIRYAIIPEGIKTWTIYDDDKNEDNGGDVKRLERRNLNNSKDRPKDWGWVILNPSLRGRPAPTTSASSTTAPASKPSK